MRNILIFVFIVFISVTSSAQDRFDTFYLAGNYNFMQTSTDDINKNYETAIMAQVRIPIVFKSSSVWFTQIDYHYFEVDNEFSTALPFERLKLHCIILKNGYVH